MAAKSQWELLLAEQIRQAGLPEPVREWRFAAPKRQWRADFGWPEYKLILEVEGGIWMRKGRHTTGVGFTRDCRKYNDAALLGITVLRVTSGMVENGEALRLLERALKGEKP